MNAGIEVEVTRPAVRTQSDRGMVMTVLGPVKPDELGFTLMHEHVYPRFWDVPARFDTGPSLLADGFSVALDAELEEYQRRGGQTLVDVTPPAVGRQPAKLRELSQRLGLHVVMGCGWYREPYYPAADGIDESTVAELAATLIEEIVGGVGAHRVQPGIIGEIGTHNSWVTAQEERVHRAVARAAHVTGLAVTLHSASSEVALEQLSILTSEGLAPDRIVVGHADTFLSQGYHRSLLEAGVQIQFDMVGMYSREYAGLVADAIAGLVADGSSSRITLSHDVARLEHLRIGGGEGYVFIHDHFLPMLRKRGVSEDAISDMCVNNPRRILTIAESTDAVPKEKGSVA